MGGGYFWKEIAAQLRTDQMDVLYHGKIGRQCEAYLAIEDMPQNMESPNLVVYNLSHILAEG